MIYIALLWLQYIEKNYTLITKLLHAEYIQIKNTLKIKLIRYFKFSLEILSDLSNILCSTK